MILKCSDLKQTSAPYPGIHPAARTPSSFDADLDRIVDKFQKYNKHEKRENYNISYCDYLNENKNQNKIDYFLTRYKAIIFVKFLNLAYRVIRKIK